MCVCVCVHVGEYNSVRKKLAQEILHNIISGLSYLEKLLWGFKLCLNCVLRKVREREGKVNCNALKT